MSVEIFDSKNKTLTVPLSFQQCLDAGINLSRVDKMDGQDNDIALKLLVTGITANEEEKTATVFFKDPCARVSNYFESKISDKKHSFKSKIRLETYDGAVVKIDSTLILNVNRSLFPYRGTMVKFKLRRYTRIERREI